MHLTPESSRLSKKAARAVGLVLALSALTAAGAQGADLVVPHSATHTVSPKAVSQPATPQPSAPSPSAAASPSAPALHAADEPGTSGVITSVPSGNPYDDVGHNAGQDDQNRVLPGDWVARMQAKVDELTANLTFGLSGDPMRDMIELFKNGGMLEQVKEMLGSLNYKPEPPSEDDGDILGISGVPTGQACGGGNYETINGDLEDPNNGIVFC
jgi:hypothetical protein